VQAGADVADKGGWTEVKPRGDNNISNGKNRRRKKAKTNRQSRSVFCRVLDKWKRE
jgi:hypothetical protein